MRNYATERCIDIALYITETGATVRQAAKKFGVSKSTVHKDVTERLYQINRSLFEQTQSILKQNKSERHLRGGAATKQKYENARQG